MNRPTVLDDCRALGGEVALPRTRVPPPQISKTYKTGAHDDCCVVPSHQPRLNDPATPTASPDAYLAITVWPRLQNYD